MVKEQGKKKVPVPEKKQAKPVEKKNDEGAAKKHASGSGKAKSNATAAASDPRFADAIKDPRFKSATKASRNFSVDKRFETMFTDKKFRDEAPVDKFGRRVDKDAKNMKNFYGVKQRKSEDNEDDDEETFAVPSASTKKPSQKQQQQKQSNNKKQSKTAPAPSFESDSSDEEGVPIFGSKRPVGEEDDEDEAQPYFGGDYAGLETSSDDDSEEEEEEATDVWEGYEEEAPIGDASRRLAVMNIDWEYLRAVDIYAFLQSFCPSMGRIKSVTILPSMFGLEKMKQDALYGPQAVFNKSVALNDHSSDEESEMDSDEEVVNDDEDSDFDDDAVPMMKGGKNQKNQKSKRQQEESEEDEDDYDDDSDQVIGEDEDEEDEDEDEDEDSKQKKSNPQKGEIISNDKFDFPDGDEEGNTEEAFNQDALRQYELEKLKYFFAIVECDSIATASTIYSEVDGVEFHSTGNVIDLRFIPDDTQFDLSVQVPKDKATEVPPLYEPPSFSTRALQSSNVELTWDRTDPRRTQLTRRKFSKDTLREIDLQAYLASSGEDDDEGGGSKDKKKDLKAKKSKEQRAKYLSLLKEVDHSRSGQSERVGVGRDEDDDESDDDEDVGMSKKSKKKNRRGADDEEEDEFAKFEDMEITFTSGLSEVGQEILAKKKERDLRATETVWETKLRKMKEAKKERKKAQKGGEDGSQDDEKEYDSDDLYADDGKGSEEEDDPFFNLSDEEGGSKSKAKKPSSGKSEKDSKKSGGKKDKKTAEELEEERRAKAELELLSLPSTFEGSGKDSSSVLSLLEKKKLEELQQEDDDKKKFKGRNAWKAKREEKRKKLEASAVLNVEDNRFSALFSSPDFALDPTDPRFKKMATADKIQAERVKRKAESASAPAPAASSSSAPAAKDSSLSSLVSSIKRKAELKQAAPQKRPKQGEI